MTIVANIGMMNRLAVQYASLESTKRKTVGVAYMQICNKQLAIQQTMALGTIHNSKR